MRSFATTAVTAAAAAAAVAAAAAGPDANVSWTAFGDNFSASAVDATPNAPACADGSPAPQSWLWNVLFNGDFDKSGRSTPLEGLPAVSTQRVATGYSTGAGWVGADGFGAVPSSTGPWCDKKANPSCTPVFLYANGGVPQNKSFANNGPLMRAHLDTLVTAANLTLPPDWDGVIGFDWEGWEPVFDSYLFTGYQNKSKDIVRATHPSWTNETQIEAEAVAQFDAGARAFFVATIEQMRAIRPKARIGFYGTPFKAWGTWWNATNTTSPPPSPPPSPPSSPSSQQQQRQHQQQRRRGSEDDFVGGALAGGSGPGDGADVNGVRSAADGTGPLVICGTGHVNERFCYLPNETAGHVMTTVGPPFPHYLSGCCELCNKTAGCQAWSYNGVKGFSCTLFSRPGSAMRAAETYKCVIGDCIKTAPPPPPPPPHPSPPPHPGPPGPAPPPTPHMTPDQRAAVNVRAHNDRLQWLWNQVDVLMPELYMPKEWGADYVRGMLREAERLVEAAHASGNTKLTIVPYTWMRYGNDDKTFLDPEHLSAEFETPFEFPHVESVLVWGDPAVGGVTIDQINAAFDAPQGLKTLIQRVGADKCKCAAAQCSGHGRCFGPPGKPPSCACFEGFSGPTCTKADLGARRHAGTAAAMAAAEARAAAATGGTVCPDGISSCAAGQTCGQFSVGRWGCCPLPNATICDNRHCCPHGCACDPVAGVCYTPSA